MRQQSLQFRRWDHAVAALFFMALFTLSLVGEISAGAWDAVGPPSIALVIAIIMFRRRPGVILRSDELVVFSDWYMKQTYEYRAIERIDVTEGSWVNPVMLITKDGAERRMPMLGLGKRPNRYERKMIDALTEVVPVTWKDVI